MKNLIVISYIAVLFVCVFSVFAETGDNLRLERLFSEAMKTDGLEYGRIRKEIISDEDAELFLIEKGKSTNVYERVISRSMMVWHENDTTNRWRIQELNTRLSHLSRFVHFPNNLLGALFARDNDTLGFDWYPSHSIVLLETAMKGTSIRFVNGHSDLDEQRENYIKPYAAGLAGNYDSLESQSILESLARESPCEFMRASALLGFSKTSSPNIFAVLLDGLGDPNSLVKDAANRKLKQITGRNFAGNRELYHEYISTNHLMEALPKVNEYVATAIQKQKAERPAFEVWRTFYQISSNEVIVTFSSGYVGSHDLVIHIPRNVEAE